MKPDLNIWKYVSLVTQVGLMMATPVVGGVLLGSYLDKRLGTKFVLTLVLTILGMILGFWNLYRMSMKDDIMGKKDDK